MILSENKNFHTQIRPSHAPRRSNLMENQYFRQNFQDVTRKSIQYFFMFTENHENCENHENHTQHDEKMKLKE